MLSSFSSAPRLESKIFPEISIVQRTWRNKFWPKDSRAHLRSTTYTNGARRLTVVVWVRSTSPVTVSPPVAGTRGRPPDPPSGDEVGPFPPNHSRPGFHHGLSMASAKTFSCAQPRLPGSYNNRHGAFHYNPLLFLILGSAIRPLLRRCTLNQHEQFHQV